MDFEDELVARQIERLQKQCNDLEVAWGRNHVKLINKLQCLADLFFVLGRYAEAEPFYWRLVEIKVIHFGERHPDTLMGIVDLADVCQALNRNDEASKYYSCAIRTLIELANEKGGMTPALAKAGMKLLEMKTSCQKPQSNIAVAS